MGGSVFLRGSVVIFGLSVSLPSSYAIWWAPGTLHGSSTHQYVLVHAVKWSHSSSSFSHLFSFSHTHVHTNTHLATSPYVLSAPLCPRASFMVLQPHPGPPWADPPPALIRVWVVRPSWGLCLGPALPPTSEKVLVIRTGPGRGPSLQGRSWEVPEGSGCLWSKILPFHQLGTKSTCVGFTPQIIPV